MSWEFYFRIPFSTIELDKWDTVSSRSFHSRLSIVHSRQLPLCRIAKIIIHDPLPILLSSTRPPIAGRNDCALLPSIPSMTVNPPFDHLDSTDVVIPSPPGSHWYKSSILRSQPTSSSKLVQRLLLGPSQVRDIRYGKEAMAMKLFFMSEWHLKNPKRFNLLFAFSWRGRIFGWYSSFWTAFSRSTTFSSRYPLSPINFSTVPDGPSDLRGKFSHPDTPHTYRDRKAKQSHRCLWTPEPRIVALRRWSCAKIMMGRTVLVLESSIPFHPPTLARV